jgi:putative membrane protein
VIIPALALLHNRAFSWTEFAVYPSFLAGWLAFGGVYVLLAGPLRHHFPGSRPVPPRMLASFATGMAIMFLALQGPLHDLSDYFLFSAHMVQHLLLILLMPPFLLAGIPDWMLRPAIKIRPIGWVAGILTFPVVAFALNNGIFAAWHIPAAYDLMMRNHDVHVAMHLMIMATGFIMWWPIMSPLPELPRLAAPLQMVYLFVLGIPMMVVAAMITYSGTVLYTWYAEAPRLWGISTLMDQQLGGAIMWVPGGLSLWLSITWVYFRWAGGEIREDEQRQRLRVSGARRVMATVPPPFPDR